MISTPLVLFGFAVVSTSFLSGSFLEFTRFGGRLSACAHGVEVDSFKLKG